MMKITLIAPGKLKEPYLREAAKEYEKRLSRYCDLTVIEPEPQFLPDDPAPAQVSAALEREAEIIAKKIPQGAYVVAFCVEGKRLTSEAFSDRLQDLSSLGKPLVLLIGSSYGLSPTLKQRADLRLSVSDMTFPHRLFRVMALEQLYRAFRIAEGSAYHK